MQEPLIIKPRHKSSNLQKVAWDSETRRAWTRAQVQPAPVRRSPLLAALSHNLLPWSRRGSPPRKALVHTSGIGASSVPISGLASIAETASPEPQWEKLGSDWRTPTYSIEDNVSQVVLWCCILGCIACGCMNAHMHLRACLHVPGLEPACNGVGLLCGLFYISLLACRRLRAGITTTLLAMCGAM
jgi:hypothetical protein